MMGNLDIEGNEVLISSIIYYNEKQNEYYAVEDMVKQINLPLSVTISLTINGQPQSLKFTVNKIDIYKNNVKTNLK